MLIPTRRGHGQDVVVQFAGLSAAPLVQGDDPDPVHGHGLHALHSEGGAGDGAHVAALPLGGLCGPHLHPEGLGLVLLPGEVFGVGPGQTQGGVGGVRHLHVDDLTGRLWKRAVECCGSLFRQ